MMEFQIGLTNTQETGPLIFASPSLSIKIRLGLIGFHSILVTNPSRVASSEYAGDKDKPLLLILRGPTCRYIGQSHGIRTRTV
jgi:hypothetical protein